MRSAGARTSVRVARLGLGALLGTAGFGVAAPPVLAAGTAWTWTIAGSPNPTPEQSNFYVNELIGVSCATPSECWAVGNTGTTAGIAPLIERYDGATWTAVQTPALKGNLFGVTCVSASDCWAVGYVDAPGATSDTYVTLIEHFDGASWTVATSPNVTTATLVQAQVNILQAITCDLSGCTAVGYYDYGVFNPTGENVTVQQTLVEQYDPTSNTWGVVSSPNTSQSLNNALGGVSCPSGGDCWAVGQAVTPNGNSQTLIEHWDGMSWTIVGSPSPSSVDNGLGGVSCPSETECWASGYYGGSITTRTLIEHYDSATSAWTVSDTPNTGPSEPNSLSDIDCLAVSQCAGIGSYTDSAGNNHGLALTFDGGSWTIDGVQDTAGNPGANNQVEDVLEGVTCTSSTECWGVGYSFDWHGEYGGFQTLIEHGVAVPAPGTSVPEAPLAALLVVPGMAGLAVGGAVLSHRRDRCSRP
ncbi:MAG: hypothetical protein ACYDAC_05060 [Candidatus Dormibacteria bacterium]